MVNRSGLIALAIAGAIVAWGAFYKDDPDPKPVKAHASRRHDGPRSDHDGKDGGGLTLASATNSTRGGHGTDAGARFGGFDGHP